MSTTPETEIINAMESPVTLSPSEVTDARYSYDLPNNEAGSETDTVTNNAANDTSASEEASESEIPGDPRAPHQTQPPTKDAY